MLIESAAISFLEEEQLSVVKPEESRATFNGYRKQKMCSGTSMSEIVICLSVSMRN